MNLSHALLGKLYAGRSPRERSMLRLAALVVAAGLLGSATDWLIAERSRLAHQLPHARALLQQMQEDAAELQRLESLPPRPDVALAVRASAAQAAARARQLDLHIEIIGDEVLRVEGNAPFDALLDWIASLHADQRLRPNRIALEQQGSRVRIEASFVDATPR